MDNEQIERFYSKLAQNLEDLTKLYRGLLDIVRKEKEILITADVEQIQENNSHKEELLMKIRLTDTLRAKHASELAQLIGANFENPRLLEIAQNLNGQRGEKLRAIHAALDIIIKRVSTINKENEDYAKSALETLSGAMSNIKETLGGKKTYAKKGELKQGPNQSGNFVSKEV